MEIVFVFAYNTNAFMYRNYSKEISYKKRHGSPTPTLSGCGKTTSKYSILNAHNSIKPGSEVGVSLTKRFFLTPRQTRRATVA
jgi:hypothetical protein